MLDGASVPIGASYAPTGGVATTLSSLGSTLNKHTLFLDENLSIVMRRLMEVFSKPPVASAGAPGGYTQQRTTVLVKVPITLGNGNVTVNTVKVEVAFDPETDAAGRTLLREFVAHLGSDTDFDDLFAEGATA